MVVLGFNIKFHYKILTGLSLALIPIYLSPIAPLFAQQSASENDQNIYSQIDQIARNNGQSQILAHELINEIGPRLTNTPQIRQAEIWAEQKFKSWGINDVQKEGFHFGQGWSINSAYAYLKSPRVIALNAIPVAWSVASNGPINASIALAPPPGVNNLSLVQSIIEGKIVMIDPVGESDEPSGPLFKRFTNKDLQQFNRATNYPYGQSNSDNIINFLKNKDEYYRLMERAGAKAILTRSRRDGQLLHGDGLWVNENRLQIPILELSAEDYRRVAALSRTQPTAMMELYSDVLFHNDDQNAYNIIAQINGSDEDAGYVMVGAHYDSWAGGDGASDNGAGVVMVMEAARILAALNIKPKRTIKFALWAAEEQGLFGSRAYAEKHLISRPAGNENDNPIADFFGWSQRYPLTKKAGYNDMKAYFNIDNGSGVIRGIYGAGDEAALPLLNQWLSHSNIKAYLASPPGISDDVIMHNIGLPSYKLIQDPLDYSTRTHHSNADTFDHLRFGDIDASAVIIAKTLWAAAQSDVEIAPRPLAAPQ